MCDFTLKRTEAGVRVGHLQIHKQFWLVILLNQVFVLICNNRYVR